MYEVKFLEIPGYGTIELIIAAAKYYQPDDYHIATVNLQFTDVNGNKAECHVLSTEQVKLIKDYFDKLHDEMERHI